MAVPKNSAIGIPSHILGSSSALTLVSFPGYKKSKKRFSAKFLAILQSGSVSQSLLAEIF